MEFILIFVIIYIISIFLTILLNKKIDLVIPITIVGMILIVYVFGIFRNLNIGVKILKLITIILGIFIIYKITKSIKNKKTKEFFKNIITPGIIIYILFFIINVVLNKNRLLELYDNFNHWVLIVKNMFLYNGYGILENSIISFNEYPPFTATFQYILLNFKGQYSEDVIIMAQNILYISMLMPLFHKVEWKSGKRKLFYIIPTVILLPMFFYRYFYTDLLVDGFIGILFALGLYEIFRNDENKKYKYGILGAYVIALSLTKNIGIIFGVLLIILEIINLIIKRNNKYKKDFIGILIIIIALVIFVGVWYLLVNIHNSELMWDETQKVQFDEEYKKNVIESIIQEVFSGSKEITVQNLSTFVLFIMYITYSIFLYQKCKNYIKEKVRLKSMLILMPIVMICYFLGMIYTYIYLFKPDETIILSSYSRYISCVLLAGFFLNTIILEEIIEWKNYYIFLVIMIILTFLPFEDIQNRYIEFNKYNISVMAKRNEYGKITKYKKQLNENDIIYIVSNKFDNLYAIALSKYEMMPIKIISEEDDSYENILKNEVTYIYILNNDIAEENEIKNILNLDVEFKEDSLYKIKKSEIEGEQYIELKLVGAE